MDFMNHLMKTGNHIVLSEIFLQLDGRSLRNARLVCKAWNDYIRDHIWAYPVYRDKLSTRLDRHWTSWTAQDNWMRSSKCVFDIAADSQEFVFSLENGNIEVWDRFSFSRLYEVTTPADLNHGLRIGLVSRFIVGGFFDKKLYVWKRIDQLHAELVQVFDQGDIKSNIHGLKVSMDKIVVSMVNGSISIFQWNCETGRIEQRLRKSPGFFHALRYLAVDDRWLLHASFIEVSLFDLVANRSVLSFKTRQRVWACSLKYPLAATMGKVETETNALVPGVTLWNLVGGSKVWQRGLKDYQLKSIAMDSRRLVVLTDHDMKVLELNKPMGARPKFVTVTEFSRKMRSDLATMWLEPDQVTFQSDCNGGVCNLNFWLASKPRNNLGERLDKIGNKYQRMIVSSLMALIVGISLAFFYPNIQLS